MGISHQVVGISVTQLVAWHSGRTSVSGRRTFPVLQLMGDLYGG